MGYTFKSCQRVIVAFESDRRCVADLINDVDAVACFFDAEAASCQNFFITLGVKLGKALAELELFAVDVEGTVRAFFTFHGIRRQGVAVDAQEVTHTGFFKLHVTCHAVV